MKHIKLPTNNTPMTTAAFVLLSWYSCWVTGMNNEQDDTHIIKVMTKHYKQVLHNDSMYMNVYILILALLIFVQMDRVTSKPNNNLR